MAARVPLVKGGNATSGPTSNGLNASQRVALADPPYLFDAPATDSNGNSWGGSITIQSTMDTMPQQQGWGIGNGVADAAARWETIVTLTNGGGPVNWSSPLYRIRANTSAVTGAGSPDVYRLEGIRGLEERQKYGT